MNKYEAGSNYMEGATSWHVAGPGVYYSYHRMPESEALKAAAMFNAAYMRGRMDEMLVPTKRGRIDLSKD